MPRLAFDMRSIRRITASASGQPGQRTFYIQARDDERLLTLLCEKGQVANLAAALIEVLEQIDKKSPPTTAPALIPEVDLELEEPLEPVFRAGHFALGYDEDADSIIMLAYELPESQDVDAETLSVARFVLTRAQARAMADHGMHVVAAGRPICPLCEEPMDASGHICPKKNGHKTIQAT